MIDIGTKRKTKRSARARGMVKLNNEIIGKIKNHSVPKGNVLENARIAGILAAKKTPALIPLCHNIEIEYAAVDFILKKDSIIVESLVKAQAKTGVEMEAMTACCVACLTIYDMCKMFTKAIEIEGVYLLEKKGGRSGSYHRERL